MKQTSVHREPQAFVFSFQVHSCGPTISAQEVKLSCRITSRLSSLLTVPRLGLGLRLPCELSKMTYLGCGPTESYPDRKAGSSVAGPQP